MAARVGSSLRALVDCDRLSARVAPRGPGPEHGAACFGVPGPTTAMRSIRAVGLSFLALAGVLACRAAVAQVVDSTLWTANSTVGAVCRHGGAVYLGGGFTSVGRYTGSGVPLDSLTGALAPSFPKVVGTILAIAPDNAGGWFLGGNFTSVGGLPRTNLAQVNSALAVTSWNPGANNEVYRLAVSGSTLYVGGFFTSIGGQPRNRIAALATATGVPTAWNPNASAEVTALAVSGSLVYVGGSFTTVGGLPRNRIAALSSSTGLATNWNPNADAFVTALMPAGTLVYAGGNFANIGGQPRTRIAALSSSGAGLATAWNPGANGAVYALAGSASAIYAGGFFSTIGGQSRVGLAALSPATGLATAWNPPPTFAQAQALLLSGSRLIAGVSGGLIAALDVGAGAAVIWSRLLNGGAIAIATSGARTFVGGSFTSADNQPRSRLAAVDAVTGALLNWNPGNSLANGFVNTIVASGPTVYVGGSFFGTVGGQPRRNVAAFDTASGLATSWNPNANAQVRTLVAGDHVVYAGGDFDSIGGQPRHFAAALIPNGAGAATAWNPNASATVYALAPFGDRVFAGGNFSSIGGQPRSRIAALDTASGLALAWNPSADAQVSALVRDGSRLIAAGQFSSIGGQLRNSLAALDTVTGTATSWNPDVGGFEVKALALSGSTVYIGGDFNSIGGQSRSLLAGVDLTSGLPTAWDPDVLPNIPQEIGVVNALALSGGRVHLGGGFAGVGPYLLLNFAAVSLPPELTAITPAQAGNTAIAHATISGANLLAASTVKLTRSGQSDILATGLGAAADALSLTGSFDVTGAAFGAWNVVVTNPDGQSATLSNAFTVEALHAAELRVDLIGSDSMRVNYRTPFDLVVTNAGNVDALAVPLLLSGIPANATVATGFGVTAPPRAGGEPDWSQAPLTLSGVTGRYVALVIPRVSPGSVVRRRVYLTVPTLNSSFLLRAGITPPWADDPARLATCLGDAGVATSMPCMGTSLAGITSYVVAHPESAAVNGVGTWAKVAFQCDGASSLPLALARAEQVLDVLVGALEAPDSLPPSGGDVAATRWADSLDVSVVGSVDPNEKLGPRGDVVAGQQLSYTIGFENRLDASVPAQQVNVRDGLNPNTLDPATVSLTSITFGDHELIPPGGQPRYSISVDVSPQLRVEVQAGLDRITGGLSCAFLSVNPVTGFALESASPDGFLPAGGRGSVLFTIRPRTGLVAGTVISNRAALAFDANPPIYTPYWSNTLVSDVPESQVEPLSPTQDSVQFTVHWDATGPPPDLRDFTIYVSDDGNPYRVWKQDTKSTADQYTAVLGHHYYFYSEARDLAGNIEPAPSVPDAQTFATLDVNDGSSLRLALGGAWPNPATGRVRAQFTLPGSGPATLELIDVTGRRVARREVGSLGAGRHTLVLGDAGRVAPGLYWLRLARREEVRTARVVVIR